MKQQVLLTFSFLFFSFSMCGSQSSISKYSRGYNLIDELFLEYQENNAKSKDLFELISKKKTDVSKQYEGWNEATSLSRRYFEKAGFNLNQFDSSNRIEMEKFLRERQKEFELSHKYIFVKDSLIKTEIHRLNQEMEKFKIKASHAQLTKNIKDLTPNPEAQKQTLKELQELTEKLKTLERHAF